MDRPFIIVSRTAAFTGEVPALLAHSHDGRLMVPSDWVPYGAEVKDLHDVSAEPAQCGAIGDGYPMRAVH